ncbi:MAG TPA: dienelactone hydrolase family protein [Bryobacteraceae bacterium]
MAQAVRASREFALNIPPAGIAGDLAIPWNAKALVVFAHGSGSSRFSPRNRLVAEVLRKTAGLATLLLDLLTAQEEKIDQQTSDLRFDIGLLAERLAQATGYAAALPETSVLPVGYFGASTGAAAALVSAAQLPHRIRAVVSRGGRPDLAGTWLPRVQAPTLLIVGGADDTVLQLNRQALESLICEKNLEMIPSATHLFKEPGALGQVAALASDWFQRYLT